MNVYRPLTTIGGLFLSASLALAQYAPAAPPAPAAAPSPRPAPRAMAAQSPMPAMAPMAPIAADPYDVAPMPAMAPLAISIDSAQIAADVQMKLEQAASMNFNLTSQKDWDMVQARASERVAEAQAQLAGLDAKFKFDATGSMNNALAMQQARTIYTGPRGSDDGMYQNGLRAIDAHQYDQALSEFNNVVAHAGARAEGGLYWKAYVLNKLGKAAEAQAAIDSLRKTYPSSRWLDDAKALELEVKQSKGPVSPEGETDEDIKVLALNGLMQSDPEKALPQVENMLKGSHSPRLKRQALVVIGQSNLPKAQQDIEQIARGGNPDLQLQAIQYLTVRRNPNTPQILLEIYNSTSDAAVKRQILNSFSNAKDKDRLLQILKTEKDGNLRGTAMRPLGDIDGQPELWQIYQAETTTEGKLAVLDVMRNNGNMEKLAEVARTDKEMKIRQRAIEVIATQQSGTPSTTLVALYSSEQDPKVKQYIIDHLSGMRTNCKPLVDIAKSEKDLQLKVRIVDRLASMAKSCPAATDYLVEVLNK